MKETKTVDTEILFLCGFLKKIILLFHTTAHPKGAHGQGTDALMKLFIIIIKP